MLSLSTDICPAAELVEELATESENFFELSLVLAQQDTDTVQFVWHEPSVDFWHTPSGRCGSKQFQLCKQIVISLLIGLNLPSTDKVRPA